MPSSKKSNKKWWEGKEYINGILVWSGKKPKKLGGIKTFLKNSKQ